MNMNEFNNMQNAAIYTGIDMPPWRIPHKVQGIIINNYALKINEKIEFVINEGIFYQNYSRLKNLIKTREVKELFFSTIHQLPYDHITEFLEIFQGIKLHFALEEIEADEFKLKNIILTNLVEFRKYGSYTNNEIIDLYINKN